MDVDGRCTAAGLWLSLSCVDVSCVFYYIYNVLPSVSFRMYNLPGIVHVSL
jgi:hypothetical protein